MAERISNFLNQKDEYQLAVNSALRYLNSGEVIVVAAESAYVYLGDAFNHRAVKTIHTLRGDPRATVAQVFVKEISVLSGIAATITANQNKILENFWPGLLSVTLPTHSGLSWDLGDERRLGKINVRIPERKFLSEILSKSGPLATASIAFSGRNAITDLSQIIVHEGDVGAIFDEGILKPGPLSTVVEFSENDVTIKREGAITRSQLAPYLALISETNL